MPCCLRSMLTWIRVLVQTHHSSLLAQVFSPRIQNIVKGVMKYCSGLILTQGWDVDLQPWSLLGLSLMKKRWRKGRKAACVPWVRNILVGPMHKAVASKGTTLAVVVTYPNALMFVKHRRNYWEHNYPDFHDFPPFLASSGSTDKLQL